MSEQLGRKDRRVTIQAPTETANSEGQPVKQWNTLRTVWCRAEYVGISDTSAEGKESNRIASYARVKFTMAYRKEMIEAQREEATPGVKIRLVYQGDYWSINQIRPMEDQMDMEVFTSRVM